MRILAVLVIICALLSVGCNSDKSDYDVGITAYERGHYRTALYDFEKRANQGDPVGQFGLGFMYEDGLGITKDIERAEELYKKSANHGYAPAQNNLAMMYYRRAEESRIKLIHSKTSLDVVEKVQKNTNIALQWFQKAAMERNDRISQYNLGLIWYYQAVIYDDLAREKNTFLELLSEVSENPEVQNILEMVENSSSLAVDAYEESVNWFTKAADNGLDRAQNELANRYYHGRGVDKNLTETERRQKAVELYTKAANQNDAKAQNSLGLRYHYGEGVDKDSTEAVKWFRKAALQGNSVAQGNLAIMYYDGEGVDPNLTEIERLKKSIEWYRKAAIRGYSVAQNNLAKMYKEGEGEEVSQNFEMAARWYFRAAQQGYSIAQANLGLNFDEGLENEIPQDHKEAYYWYSLALKDSDGLDTAEDNFAEKVKVWQQSVGNKLSEKQREDILKHVDNWEPKDNSDWSGTGFYIHENYILTNAHVVTRKNHEGNNHEFDEFRIPYRRVELIAWDPEVDLALLYDEHGNTDTATFRNYPVYMEEKIASFGYPRSHVLSYEGNSTPGTVSGPSGMLNVPHPDNYFQHTAPIQGGNSGGPIFDLMGNVVGVTKYGMQTTEPVVDPPQNVNFAIEFDVIKEFLQKNGFEEDSGDSIDKEKIYKVHYISTEDLRSSSNQGNISKKAEKFTVPVLCFKNKGPESLSMIEIGIGDPDQ